MSRPQALVLGCGTMGALLAGHLAGHPACRTVFCLAKGLEPAARLRHPIPTMTEPTRP